MPKIVEAKKTSVADMADMCKAAYKKHIGGDGPWRGLDGWRYGQWGDTLNRLKTLCEDQDIDPALYIDAQFCTMRLWSQSNGGRFYPNVMMGANAIKRYESYKERNKRHTKNIATRSGDEDHIGEVLNAETMYGELVLKNLLWGLKGKAKDIARIVRTRFPLWKPNNPEFAAVRRRALMVVLDKNIPACSTKVFIKRDFTWKNVALFIQQMGYDTRPHPKPVEKDLKGLLSRRKHA